MPFNRTVSCVAIGFLFLLLLAAPSPGQGPLGFQIFAPADVSTFGGEQQPNEGYFFQFDGLYWSLSAPKVKPLGYPGTRTVYYGPHPTDAQDPINDKQVQSNTLDSSGITDKFSAANRIEFGRVEDRNGWLVSIYQQRDQTQDNVYGGANMVFRDPPQTDGNPLLFGNVNNNSNTTPPYTPPVFRNLPVVFTSVTVENAIDTWGVEADYLHRFMTSHYGGTLELFLGARYYEFNDNFNVHTGGDTGATTVPSFLGGSFWDTQAANHVVGPQIGLRWFKKQGRWTFNTESRFFAGINMQNISQQADIGPGLNPGPSSDGSYPPFVPQTMSHTTASHYTYACEFSPAIELRLEGRYQITRAISFHAGWTGMWMDGVARASSLVYYQVPAMGIDMTDNRQSIFVNGLSLGFDVNR
jgi:hypothetical protein